MKRTALRFLVCPRCQGELDLRVDAADDTEVVEGTLTCLGCAAEYAVTAGIPRFVDSSRYAQSFAFQWHRFRAVQLDSANGTRQSEHTFTQTAGWASEDCRGRLALDVGVGAGRFAEVAAQRGAEVVGLDLSDAVDAAYANLGRHPSVHLVQADLFAMPFRAGTFDLAYSIGVLHHTPDPQNAFSAVATSVKPGGQLAVYFYPDYFVGRRTSDLLRRLTTRLPPRLMYWLSAGAIPLYYLYRLPLLGPLLQALLPISMHADRRWRWLDTFDWYTPRYQWKLSYPQVYHFFQECQFDQIELFDEPIRMRGTKRLTAVAHGTAAEADSS